MNFPLKLVGKRWQDYANLIHASWQKGVESILETGRHLIAAKDDLEHGSFEAMVQTKLPFGPRTAQRLIKIAEHPILSKATHASDLPPSWMTLYELTKLDEDALIAKIKNGTITPKTERKDVREMRERPPTKQKPPEKIIEAYAAVISKYPREDQIRILRGLRDKLDIALREFADGHLELRK